MIAIPLYFFSRPGGPFVKVFILIRGEGPFLRRGGAGGSVILGLQGPRFFYIYPEGFSANEGREGGAH